MAAGKPEDAKAHWNRQVKAVLIVVLASALLLCWWFDFP
jgi:hypothetical protein